MGIRAPENHRPRVRVGVVGASGTTGTELVGLVRRHPRLALTFATSREHAGRSLRAVDPAADDVRLVDPGEVEPGSVDVDAVFLCLPHGRSAEHAARWRAAGPRVVDLSGDLRLRDAAVHARVYGSPRDEALAAESVYGLTEHARDDVARARIVSNPGCYPTCAALALWPLADRIDGPVVVNALSGVSGAGRKAVPLTHFCAVADDARPYKLGRSHRHAAEIAQSLAAFTGGAPPAVIFNPHVVPLERGMLATITVRAPGLSVAAARELYLARYADEPFVEVLPPGEPARIRHAARTHRAVIGLHEVEGDDHLVITCAIDNLLKGAAGQAVQNLNRMLGWPETLGSPEHARFDAPENR